MGIYAIARRVASVMLKAPQALDPIFSSIVSELAYHRRQEELGHRFVVISRWVLMVNLPVFAVLLLIGDRILPMFSKGSELGLADLETGFRILVILSVGMLAQGLFAIIEPLLAMAGRPQLNLYNNLFWIAANFGLNLWLIGRMGIEGAAWGATLSMTAVNALRLIEVRVFHRINPFQVSQLKPLAAAALAGCGAWGAASTVEGWVQIGVVLLAFLPLYVLGLWLLGLEAEDRALWRRLVRRLRRQRGPDAA